ncbi:RebB family R body protein [Mucilaginibacter sp. HMF5004]|uniref:RebB family R body protein n=1 Tax=Mucilaginibacter rivuli TaxID=2857527 RepID=UPI001C601119|nr:RebB family R body protein [Mucilaginibacter rivuli]MBW4891054.1 RebB family R body protein [Mucilaginibacter rivuli]
MPDPSPVNSQITDKITQTNIKVEGESPAQAMGNLYQQLQDQSEPQENVPETGE